MSVYGYVRVSTEGQEDGTSLDEQRARIEAFAVARGWTLAGIHSDVASGTTFERPAFKALQEALTAGDTVLVLALSRLSRTLTDGYPQVLAWQQRGISFFSVTEPIETSSAMGRHMLRMVFDFAQTEREVLLERIEAGRRRNAERGGWNGGPTPYGYLRLMEGPNDFAVEEGEASVVRQLFKLYATGRFGLTRLKRAAGCPLSESAIANVLSNPFYLGQLRYAGTTRPNAHPAVVSRALFAQVQRIREARTPRSPRAKPLGTLGEACLTHPAR